MSDDTVRNEYISRVIAEIFGPAGGDEECLPLNDPPHKRYITGVLYPRVEKEGSVDVQVDLEEESGSVIADADEPDDSPLADMLQRSPASAGMTFAVSENAQIRIECQAARYEKYAVPTDDAGQGVKLLKRRSLNALPVFISDECPGDSSHEIFHQGQEFLATLRIRWRVAEGCRIVTVSMVNKKEVKPDSRPNSLDCLFQVGMKVSCERGTFLEPPSPDVAFDVEERSLRLRYRHKIQWATGHAASVAWPPTPAFSAPESIRLDFTPVADTHPFTAGVRDGASFDAQALSICRLSQVSDADELRGLLEPFIDDFESWLDSQASQDLPPEYAQAKSEVMAELVLQEQRLRRGLEVLCSTGGGHVFDSFRLANEAMLIQMQRSAEKSGRKFDSTSAMWRPFQLAFQLLSIPGCISDEESSGCDIVDLIWFPTGGGKTEAYLLLAAFVIIHRRLAHGVQGEGTCVLSRYTLRLLTSQQFDRTATLACALEYIRRQGRIPGETPIEIGLWIGGGENSAPNTKRQARVSFEKMLEEDRPRNRFMLNSCPWCGTSILPDRRSSEESYGVRFASRLEFHCPDSECSFHSSLPVQVVDECLYERPPSILLATIDKFARIPWEARSKSFFGIGCDHDYLPPDLVIQDELHLISGPLGTVASIYEAAIDQLLQHRGSKPKYVAATATIRGAKEQSKRLYGRQTCIFPAPGLDVDDSYYMQIDRDDSSSRRYLGVMGQGHTPVTTTVHVMAAMVHAGGVVSDGDEYWTLVAYHNSKRELGKTMTLAKDDVPARIKVIAQEDPDSGQREDQRQCHEVVELSGSLKGYQVPKVLDRMQASRGSADAIDVLPCTNMISVGVDVERLNSMLILGQPKMSSEYIQASSRVGRGRRIGGVVVAAFSPTKPRDRSHYENFQGFHESMYRWVEPTSVTPQSPAALDRALHASLIMALRIQYLWRDEDAGKFDASDSRHQAAIEALRFRIHQAIPAGDRTEFDAIFNSIVEWWSSSISENGGNLSFESQSQFKGLMRHYDSKKRPPARPTLNSMRNVDGEARGYVRGGNH